MTYTVPRGTISSTIGYHTAQDSASDDTYSKQAAGGRTPRYASARCKLTISSYLFARWHLFRHVDYLRHQQQVDLWPFDLESGVRVTRGSVGQCIA